VRGDLLASGTRESSTSQARRSNSPGAYGLTLLSGFPSGDGLSQERSHGRASRDIQDQWLVEGGGFRGRCGPDPWEVGQPRSESADTKHNSLAGRDRRAAGVRYWRWYSRAILLADRRGLRASYPQLHESEYGPRPLEKVLRCRLAKSRDVS